MGLKKFEVVIPLPVIEAEFEDEVFEIGRPMLAERDWEDWQVAIEERGEQLGRPPARDTRLDRPVPDQGQG